MSKLIKSLKADIESKEIVTKVKEPKKKVSKQYEFKILEGTKYITLSEYEQKFLLKALEIYFPDLAVEIKFAKTYNISCEEDLDIFLKRLDIEMSKPDHFELYKNCTTDEYEFLRKLRLKYMTK